MEGLDGVERLEGVGSAYAAARDGIDSMLRDRGLRQTSPELTAESLLRGAHASAVLAGSASSLDEVRAGAVTRSPRVPCGCRWSCSVWCRSSRARPRRRWPGCTPWRRPATLPDDERGRPRDAESAARLRASLALLDSRPAGADDGRPAARRAGVRRRRSPAANGIVARAAERLVMVSSGVDAKALVVPEAGHLALRPAYESNLRAYANGGRPGLQAWLLYCAEAYAAGAEASPLRG